MSPHPDVIIINDFQRDVLYGQLHFAPARRAGDFVFCSGVIAGPKPGESVDAAGFEVLVAKAFDGIGQTLAAAGGSLASIAEITSYHVFANPVFKGSKADHLRAFQAGKDARIAEPYPAWTAIGVEGLFLDEGLVEIKVTAHIPKR